MNEGPSISTYVDEQRLWQRHMAMAEIGATPKGGLDRQSLTAEDIEARALLARWAGELGFACEMDPIGNMFIRRPGTDTNSAPVMSGSHLDTQPAGGRFDGISGVLAAFEVLEAMEQSGVQTRRPIEVVNWTNEEGARFQPATMGSLAFLDNGRLNAFLAIRDAQGIPVHQEIAAARAALQNVGPRELGAEVAALVEVHIEQGTILEQNNKTVGVVTGIQGVRRFLVQVHGEAGHAGTIPHKMRKDAFQSSCKIVDALNEIMHDPDDLVRFTIGRFMVVPNSPGTIPERVEFTVDFRHPSQLTLDRLGNQVAAVCQKHAGPCTAMIEEVLTMASADLDNNYVPDLIRKSAQSLDMRWMDIYSPAMHDALNLAQICPTGMIFIPCERGISHNEAENVEPSHLADGTKVLANVLFELAMM